MSRIFAVGRGYADTLKTGEWDEGLLPKSFKITKERLRRTADAHAHWVRERGANTKVVAGHIIDGDALKAKTKARL